MKVYSGKCNKCEEPDKIYYGLNKVCSDCQNSQAQKRGRILTNEFMRIGGKQIF